MRLDLLRRARAAGDWLGSDVTLDVFRAPAIVQDAAPADSAVGLLELSSQMPPGLKLADGALDPARERRNWPERRADRCFVAVVNDVIAGHGWVRERGTVQLLEVGADLRLPEGAVALYDFLVAPSVRGQGVYRGFLRALRARYGASETLIYAERTNAASLRGIRAAGFETVLSITARRRFGRYKVQLLHLSPGDNSSSIVDHVRRGLGPSDAEEPAATVASEDRPS